MRMLSQQFTVKTKLTTINGKGSVVSIVSSREISDVRASNLGSNWDSGTFFFLDQTSLGAKDVLKCYLKKYHIFNLSHFGANLPHFGPKSDVAVGRSRGCKRGEKVDGGAGSSYRALWTRSQPYNFYYQLLLFKGKEARINRE